MGVRIRASLQALRRRFSPWPTGAAVRAALRDQASIASVKAVEVSATEHGGALVTVDLCVAEGADAREAACCAADRLLERLPAAEIHVHVSTSGRT